MVETCFQSASNEVTSLASDSLENGEVPPIVLPITGDELVALQTQQLISSAAQLGFTNAQVEAFLNSITSEPAMMPEPKIDISSPQYAQDPSLSKMPENNIYDLRRVAQDKFTSTTKKNKDRFDRLDRVLEHNGLYTMARKTRTCPKFTDSNPTGQTFETMVQLGDVVTITKADNFRLWSHDMTRLLHFLDQSFDNDIRHHTNGFTMKNGIKAYNDLREYYFGQNNQGVQRLSNSSPGQRLLPSLKTLSDSKSFVFNASTLSTCSSTIR